jgi:hypothetical protein
MSFRFFELFCARLTSKLAKSANTLSMTPPPQVFSKNAEFDVDFESIENL